ncbi:MAG: hypothetical protein ACREIP_22025 [Alphaproteobacteria bacterium]
MHKIATTALLVVLAAGIAAPANALPLAGPHLAARIVNAEFRGYTNTGRGFENQIWHFLPDGRIRAVADSQRLLRRELYRQEWQDIGAWRLEANRVCVAFEGPNRNLNGCYAVDARSRKQVRLVGPYVWEGTLESYE